MLLVVLLGITPDAVAQGTEEDWQILNRIFEASNSVRPETAREAQAQCAAIGKEIAARTDMLEVQRLALQAEVESCISYAMNNGQYEDETGDQCSHHLAFARLLTDAILEALKMEGIFPEQFADARDRLQRASEVGPQMGCNGDYASLLASLPTAEEIAAAQNMGRPNSELQGRFEELKYSISAEGSEQWLPQCRALGEEVERRGPSLHEVERWYFSALVEDCVARTMAMSGFSDETGDACAHHHLFAQNLSLALVLNKETPFFEDTFRQFMTAELETAMQQGPGMGCTEDYAGLAVP